MDEFVALVVKGEGGSGTVFLDGASNSPDSIVTLNGFVLAVWTDGDDEPTYTSAVEATDAALKECKAKLEAGGLDVIRDSKKWAKLLKKWG